MASTFLFFLDPALKMVLVIADTVRGKLSLNAQCEVSRESERKVFSLDKSQVPWKIVL